MNECIADNYHYDDLYEYFFGRLRNEINLQRSRMHGHIAARSGDDRFLFKLGDSDPEDALAKSVFEYARERVAAATCDLIALMLLRGNQHCRTEDVIVREDMIDEKFLNENPQPVFYIRGELKVIAFVCTNDFASRQDLMSLAITKGVDGAVDIVLMDPSCGNEQDAWLERHKEWARQNNAFLDSRDGHVDGLAYHDYVSIEAFFRTCFGGEEFLRFMQYVRAFNEYVWDNIALSTVEVPTTLNLNSYKEEYLSRVRAKCDDFKQELLGMGMKNTQYVKIRDRFLEQDRCRALLGNCDFATSFLSSEWLYGIHRITEVLDQTGTASGYIKSVEQLLFDVALLTHNKGNRIPTGKDKETREYKYSPFDDSLDLNKLTFWNLERYFHPETNVGLLDVDDSAGKTIWKILDTYRDQYRNGYFHRDNIAKLPLLEEIRHQTFLCYFLILGSVKLNDENLKELGIPVGNTAANSNEPDLKICKWIQRVLGNPIVSRRLSVGNCSIVIQFDRAWGGDIIFGERPLADCGSFQLDMHILRPDKCSMTELRQQCVSLRTKHPNAVVPSLVYESGRPIKDSFATARDAIALSIKEDRLLDSFTIRPAVYVLNSIPEHFSMSAIR